MICLRKKNYKIIKMITKQLLYFIYYNEIMSYWTFQSKLAICTFRTQKDILIEVVEANNYSHYLSSYINYK